MLFLIVKNSLNNDVLTAECLSPEETPALTGTVTQENYSVNKNKIVIC